MGNARLDDLVRGAAERSIPSIVIDPDVAGSRPEMTRSRVVLLAPAHRDIEQGLFAIDMINEKGGVEGRPAPERVIALTRSATARDFLASS